MSYSPKVVKRIFDALFLKARQKDEFEFACALLRIRGLEDAGWDPLFETQFLYRDITSLASTPLELHTRTRLLLLLYAHLTEVDAVYNILDNILRTIEGNRCSIDPFMDLYRPKGKARFEQIPPSASAVVSKLKKHANTLKEEDLVKLLDWMFNSQIRNSFFHSDYTLYRDEFRSRHGKFLQKENYYSSSLKIEDLFEVVNRALSFFQNFMFVYYKNVRSYKMNKIVQGRFGPNGEIMGIELMADKKRGLHGFKSSTASLLKKSLPPK